MLGGCWAMLVHKSPRENPRSGKIMWGLVLLDLLVQVWIGPIPIGLILDFTSGSIYRPLDLERARLAEKRARERERARRREERRARRETESEASSVEDLPPGSVVAAELLLCAIGRGIIRRAGTGYRERLAGDLGARLETNDALGTFCGPMASSPSLQHDSAIASVGSPCPRTTEGGSTRSVVLRRALTEHVARCEMCTQALLSIAAPVVTLHNVEGSVAIADEPLPVWLHHIPSVETEQIAALSADADVVARLIHRGGRGPLAPG